MRLRLREAKLPFPDPNGRPEVDAGHLQPSALCRLAHLPDTLHVAQIPGGFEALDANGQALVHAYARETSNEANIAGALTFDERSALPWMLLSCWHGDRLNDLFGSV
jgi:hypothetical protein